MSTHSLKPGCPWAWARISVASTLGRYFPLPIGCKSLTPKQISFYKLCPAVFAGVVGVNLTSTEIKAEAINMQKTFDPVDGSRWFNPRTHRTQHRYSLRPQSH
jgi:hypothetical protein